MRYALSTGAAWGHCVMVRVGTGRQICGDRSPMARAKKVSRDLAQNSFRANEFATRQAQLLAKHSKVGERAPGRARVDLIIETAIKLLTEHKRHDITISMIADAAGMTRTSIY